MFFWDTVYVQVTPEQMKKKDEVKSYFSYHIYHNTDLCGNGRACVYNCRFHFLSLVFFKQSVLVDVHLWSVIMIIHVC